MTANDETKDTGARVRRGAASARGTVAWVSIVVAYCAASMAVYWPMAPFSTGQTIGCGCFDAAEQIWFLAWTPHALVHALNPFFSSALNVPFGVNLASNTSMPLLGALGAPITWTLGPVATFNFLMRAALVLSALSMCLAVRRFVRSRLVAFAAGLLYGFSPYERGQAAGHLNLLFVAIPPLVIVCLDELVRPRRWSPRRSGLTLGALLALQYFVSLEVLGDLVAVVALTLLVLALASPRTARARARDVGAGLSWALLPVILLTGYPDYLFLAGPEHLNAPAQPVATLAGYHIDLLGPIIPTVNELVAPAHLAAVGSSFGHGDLVENGAYLGIPLALLALACVVYARRDAIVRACAIGGAIAFVLSLGPSLVVDNHDLRVPLPFALFDKISGLQVEVPGRYSLFMQLAVATVAACGVDRFIQWRSSTSARPMSRTRAGAALLAGVVALVPVIPRLPIATVPADVPTYFTDARVDRIPAGSVLLAYPYPEGGNNFAMLWQAVSGFRFDIIGVYANVPLQLTVPPGTGGGPGGGLSPPTLDPAFVQILFQDAFSESPKTPGGDVIPYIAQYADRMREFFVNYDVETVVVDKVGADWQNVQTFVTGVLGERPVDEGSIEIWYRVQERLGTSPRR